MMAQIKSKDTKPELVIRRALHSMGFRYSLHVKQLPGKPDIVLRKYNAIVQVNGCFWHMHGCKYSTIPKSNSAFWAAKLTANRARDEENNKRLVELGWRLCVVWECAIRDRSAEEIISVANALAEWIRFDVSVFCEIT
jgi:DNA mismatch endonuclease (patch repair protein)